MEIFVIEVEIPSLQILMEIDLEAVSTMRRWMSYVPLKIYQHNSI